MSQWLVMLADLHIMMGKCVLVIVINDDSEVNLGEWLLPTIFT